ncbi:MAG: hypothetical protein AAGF12_05615 [Myxococcota bacterium]
MVLPLGLALLGPRSAAADEPRFASDGLLVGLDVGSGAGIFVGWDADFYFDDQRLVSLGPAVGFTSPAAGARPGMSQDYRLTADLRLNVALFPNEIYRPHVLLGVGASFTRLAEDTIDDVAVDGAGGAVVGSQLLPGENQFAGLAVFGFGVDLFLRDSAVALTGTFYGGYQLGASERQPDVFLVLAVGARLGY